MKYLVDLPKFIVPLGDEAREQAKKFQSYQPDPQQAKQVYLNTLAIYATSFYLEMLDFETDLAGSNSQNPAVQAFMDSADLNLPGLGKLECVPISSETEVAHIPFDALEDRIGYVFVQIKEQGTEAIIWGFADKVETEEFFLEGLRAIDELPEYLLNLTKSSQKKPQDESIPAYIKRLIERMLQDGWEQVKNLADVVLSQPNLPALEESAFSAGVARAQSSMVEKDSHITDADQSFCRIVYLERSKQEIEICTIWTDISDSEPEFDISVLIHTSQSTAISMSQLNSNTDNLEDQSQFLPMGLKISMTFPDGEVHDSVCVETQTKQVKLKELSVFGNTQFNIEIRDSDFIFVDSLCSPD